jgi:hypothetical protein
MKSETLTSEPGFRFEPVTLVQFGVGVGIGIGIGFSRMHFSIPITTHNANMAVHPRLNRFRNRHHSRCSPAVLFSIPIPIPIPTPILRPAGGEVSAEVAEVTERSHSKEKILCYLCVEAFKLRIFRAVNFPDQPPGIASRDSRKLAPGIFVPIR